MPPGAGPRHLSSRVQPLEKTADLAERARPFPPPNYRNVTAAWGVLPGICGSRSARLGILLRISGFAQRTTEPLKMSAGFPPLPDTVKVKVCFSLGAMLGTCPDRRPGLQLTIVAHSLIANARTADY